MKKMIFALTLFYSSLIYADGEILKINTTGKEYCVVKGNRNFNPSNDINLWIKFNDMYSAELYSDENLNNWVANLPIYADWMEWNKLIFTSVYKNGNEFLSLMGTIKYDNDNRIISMKATVISEGILTKEIVGDYCRIKGSMNGKRIN